MLDMKDVNFGFDAQKGEYLNIVKAGVIDPTKVVRTAPPGAVSVAGLLITDRGDDAGSMGQRYHAQTVA